MSLVVITLLICLAVGGLLLIGIRNIQEENGKATGAYAQAIQELGSGNLEAAEKMLRESFAENPEHTESAIQLLEVYERQGKEQSQISLCRNLLTLYDAGQKNFAIEHVQLKLADILWKQGKYEECLYHYAQVAQKEKVPRVLARVGFILASQGRFDQAMVLFQQALEKDPYEKDANRGQVLCYLGSSRFEEARDGLLDAMADNSASNLDSYLLARIFKELGDLQSAQNYYMDFLLQLESKNSLEGYEALQALIPVYEEKGAKLKRRELDVWLRVFGMCIDRMFLRPKLKHTILFHQVLLAVLRDYEINDFRVALEALDRMERLELKLELEESMAIKMKKGIDEGWSLERWQEIFLQNRNIDRTLFSSLQPFDVKNYFEIPPISPRLLDQVMSPGFLRSVKAKYEANSHHSPAEFSSMTAQRFRTMILAGLKDLGYEHKSTLPADSSGTAIYFRMRFQSKGECLVVCYRNDGEIGELEIQEILNLLQQQMLHKVLLITVGQLTSEAQSLANSKGIECWTMSQFQDQVRRAA